jgi:hypothetical protein
VLGGCSTWRVLGGTQPSLREPDPRGSRWSRGLVAGRPKPRAQGPPRWGFGSCLSQPTLPPPPHFALALPAPPPPSRKPHCQASASVETRPGQCCDSELPCLVRHSGHRKITRSNTKATSDLHSTEDQQFMQSHDYYSIRPKHGISVRNSQAPGPRSRSALCSRKRRYDARRSPIFAYHCVRVSCASNAGKLEVGSHSWRSLFAPACPGNGVSLRVRANRAGWDLEIGHVPPAKWETGEAGSTPASSQLEAGSVADAHMPTVPGWQTPLR